MTAKVVDLQNCDTVLTNVVKKYVDNGLKYGWKSNVTSAFDQGHWNNQILPGSQLLTFDQQELPTIHHHPEVKAIWNTIQEIIGPRLLYRAYVNGNTYGVDSYYHRDDTWMNIPGDDTITETIVIYLNKEWDKNWGGVTHVLNEAGEIELAVMPKFGRMFIFDSSKLHSASPLSRICPAMRSVLVFKTMGPSNISPQVKFIHKVAKDLPHTGRSLFDHLYNTAMLLESHKFERDVVFAGLFHSIYGTEFYSNSKELGIDREAIKFQIGDYSESLVHTFCNTKNRYEKLIDQSSDIDPKQRRDLIAIEIANLIDQNDLGQYNSRIEELDKIISEMNTQ